MLCITESAITLSELITLELSTRFLMRSMSLNDLTGRLLALIGQLLLISFCWLWLNDRELPYFETCCDSLPLIELKLRLFIEYLPFNFRLGKLIFLFSWLFWLLLKNWYKPNKTKYYFYYYWQKAICLKQKQSKSKDQRDSAGY